MSSGNSARHSPTATGFDGQDEGCARDVPIPGFGAEIVADGNGRQLRSGFAGGATALYPQFA